MPQTALGFRDPVQWTRVQRSWPEEFEKVIVRGAAGCRPVAAPTAPETPLQCFQIREALCQVLFYGSKTVFRVLNVADILWFRRGHAHLFKESSDFVDRLVQVIKPFVG